MADSSAHWNQTLMVIGQQAFWILSGCWAALGVYETIEGAFCILKPSQRLLDVECHFCLAWKMIGGAVNNLYLF